MTTHVLKTCPIYFDAVKRGEKLFEVRRNDRFFQLGDQVDLAEYDPAVRAYVTKGGFSNHARNANRLSFLVGPVLQGGQFGLEAGYCAFTLLPLPAAPRASPIYGGRR